jgi:hypothetical protein
MSPTTFFSSNPFQKMTDECEAIQPCYSIRILYSTQSGRAKACARRTARILSSNDHSRRLRLQNGAGTAFDEDLIHEGRGFVADWADSLRRQEVLSEDSALSQPLLILFVSTTGDGEHTDTIQQMWTQL